MEEGIKTDFDDLLRDGVSPEFDPEQSVIEPEVEAAQPEPEPEIEPDLEDDILGAAETLSEAVSVGAVEHAAAEAELERVIVAIVKRGA